MTLTLDLPTALATQLEQQAAEHGVKVEDYALTLLQTLTGVFADPGAERETVLSSAMRMYDLRLVSLGTAAQMAGLSQSEFIEALGKAKISVLQYTAEEALAEAGVA